MHIPRPCPRTTKSESDLHTHWHLSVEVIQVVISVRAVSEVTAQVHGPL